MDKNDDVPPTEPASKNKDVGKPASAAALVAERDPKPTKAKSAPVGKTTRTPGSDLVPDLGKHTAVTRKLYTFWVGVTPSCPVESVDVAGINFPKLNERIIKDPARAGGTKRVPVIGALVHLDQRKIDLLRERLPRLVMRFPYGEAGAEGVKDEPGTGQNLGDLHIRPRKGFPITIPTEAELKAAEKRGKPGRGYVPKDGDEPAARYLFAVLCEDQKHPTRGDFYPPTLEDSGLEWPDPAND